MNTASAELIERYVLHLDRRELDPRSSRDRADRALVVFAGWLGSKSIADATADDIEAWLDTRKLGANSRRWYLANLSSFYKWAIKRSGLVRNPVDLIDRPRTSRGVPRPISDADLDKALANADPRMRAWLCLAAYAGLRCQEIAGVRRQDVLDDRDPPMLVVVDGKGGKQRLVPLHPALLEALQALDMPEEGHLWMGYNNRPMTPRWVTLAISAYMRSIGVKATAHQLRHWFGTTVFHDSKDIRLTQEMMGHADSKTTTIYVAFDPGDAVPIVQGLSIRARRAPTHQDRQVELAERFQAMLRPIPRPSTLRSLLDAGTDLASVSSIAEFAADIWLYRREHISSDRDRDYAAHLRSNAEAHLAGRPSEDDEMCLRAGQMPEAPDKTSVTHDLWHAELLEDPALFTRFLQALPPEIAAEQAALDEAQDDLERRRYRLDVEAMPSFQCSSCGETREAQSAVSVIDRWNEAWERLELVLCSDCLGAAARRMELASA